MINLKYLIFWIFTLLNIYYINCQDFVVDISECKSLNNGKGCEKGQICISRCESAEEPCFNECVKKGIEGSPCNNDNNCLVDGNFYCQNNKCKYIKYDPKTSGYNCCGSSSCGVDKPFCCKGGCCAQNFNECNKLGDQSCCSI